MSIILKILIVPFSCLLLCMEASREEAEIFLMEKLEPLMTEACYNLGKAHFEYKTDLMNETKARASTNATIYTYKLLNKLLDELFAMDLYSHNSSHRNDSFDLQIDNAYSQYLIVERTNITKEASIAVEEQNYGFATICPYYRQNCSLPDEGLGETDIDRILKVSTDYDRLVYLWKAWRDVTGRKLKKMYQGYFQKKEKETEELNKTANGEIESDFAPYHLKELQPLRFWKKLEPLYTELHKYVGRKLKTLYGESLDISDGLIPAHVFGSMFGESWVNLEDRVKPFPYTLGEDSEYILKTKFRVLDMFKAVDEFHQSLGLEPLDDVYNDNVQMITQPDDGRVVDCSPESFDLCNDSYRLSLCSHLSMDYFAMIHHELGHIQYFKQYRHQPFLLKGSPSPFIGESIGDVIALSALSPAHLRKISLVTYNKDTYETSINYLMKMALEKIAFLPFALTVELWKWDVKKRKAPQGKLNSHWWKYRKEIQKMKPPVPRSDETDLDIGASYRTGREFEYMPYFFAYIAQFEIFKNLCWKAHLADPEQYKICPLFNCDFFNSTEAGTLLKDALSAGDAKDWKDVYETLSGSRTINVEPILEYFQPLYEYLLKENRKPHIIYVLDEAPKTESHTLLIVLVTLACIAVITCAVVFVLYKKGLLNRCLTILQ